MKSLQQVVQKFQKVWGGLTKTKQNKKGHGQEAREKGRKGEGKMHKQREGRNMELRYRSDL